MEKMSWVVDLETQQISKLNKHLLVIDGIRKARRSTRQGNGWLGNKLLNLNGDGTPVPSLSISSKGSALTKRSVGPQVQNDHVTRSGTCIPSLKSPPLTNPDHGSKAPAVLLTFRGSAQPLFTRTDEVARLGSNGSHNDENVYRPPQLHDPLLMPTQGVAEAAETPNPAHFIQVPPLTSSPTRITNLSAINIGPGFGLGDLEELQQGKWPKKTTQPSKLKRQARSSRKEEN
jgi:hypothetical protein